MTVDLSARLGTVASAPSVFERELFSEAEAARLLGLPTATLHHWLEGGVRRGVQYDPIIRRLPVGRRTVSWAEFIEAGWLSVYRRRKQIPALQLRLFVEVLRSELGVPYPLAHSRPWVSGRPVMLRAQEEAGLDPEFQVVSTVGNQLMLTHAGSLFVERVVWDGDVAAGWKPHSADSPVEVRPDLRFGRPAVSGISTVSIFDEADGGASADEIAADFGISVSEVRWALSYEEQRHAAA